MAGKTTYELALEIGGKIQSSLEKSVGGVNKKLDSIGKAAKTAAKIATAAFAAVKVGDFMKGAVSTYADFDQAMANTAATAGASEEGYRKLEEAALEMGKKTTKTATEASEALGYMALAGWDVETSVSALEPVLRLSEATSMDLATCSDLVTDSMSALGLTVDELSGYLDVACKANNKSNQTAQQLMEAYIGCGGVMNNLGVDAKDSAAALGVLANRGIKGSEAGNKLNTVMINLTSGTGQAGKMMEQLGISAFDSEGKFIGLKETLELVNNATKGLTEEERNAALAAIGGKTQIDTLNDLLSGLNTTTSDGQTEWQALREELGSADGAMMEMAGKVTDTLPGAMAVFGSAVDDAKIRLCKIFAPAAKEAVFAVADYIPNITENVTGFIQKLSGKAAPAIQSFKNKAVAFFGEIRPAVEDIGSKGAAAFRFLAETGQTSLKNVKSAIEENKPAIDKVITVALDLKDKLFQAFETAKPAVSFMATQALPQVVGAAVKLAGAAGTVYEKLNEWGVLKPVIIGIAGAIAAVKMANFARDTLNTVNGVRALVTVFVAEKQAMMANLALKIKDKAETLYLHALYAKDAIVRGASTAATWAQTAAQTAWNGVCAVGTAATTALGAAFAFLTSPIGIAIAAVAAMVAIGVALYKNWDTIKEKAGQLKDWVGGKFAELKEKVAGKLDEVKQKALETWNHMKESAGTVLETVKTTVEEKLSGVRAAASEAFTNVKTTVSDLTQQAASTARANLESMMAAYVSAGGGIKGAMSASMQGVKNTFSSAMSAVNTITGGKLEAVRTAFQSKLEGAKSVVANGLNAIKGLFSGASLKLPDIKLPHFSINGSFSLSPPSIPKIGVEWYKNGGILTGPTIFGARGNSLLGGGEAGHEAVLPLSQLWSNMKTVVAGAVGAASSQNTGAADAYDKAWQLTKNMGDTLDGGSVTRQLYNTVNNTSTIHKTREADNSDNSQKIVYSPQIFIQGNAGQKDVESALRMSQAEFDRMCAERERQRVRTSFNT